MFKSIFTNSFGILISRIFGFLRDMMMAATLGANIYSDIFFIAFKLPNLFRRIFAEGAFAQTFIPSFIRSHNKAIFSMHIFIAFSLILAVFTLIVSLFPSFFTKLIAFGFDQKTIELASPFVAINFYYLIVIFFVTFLSTFLQYKNHFATTSFATSLLNISLISALYLFKDSDQIVIVEALSYAVVIGGLLQLIAHILALKYFHLEFIFSGGLKYYKKEQNKVKKETKKFKSEFIPAVIGGSTAQISAFIDTWLASFLVTGSISYIYYANRIFQLPLALFAIATTVALFPRISRYIKNSDHKKALEMFDKSFWFLTYLLTLASLGGFILSKEIIWLLFEHGSFSTSDTQNTALVLQMYMIGLLTFGLAKLFSLWLYASQMQKKAAKIASISLVSNIIFSLALIKPLGAMGLALASSLSGFILLFLTLKEFKFEEFFAIITFKKLTIYLSVMLSFTVILILFKDFIDVYI